MWLLVPAVPVAACVLVLFALRPAHLLAVFLRVFLFLFAAGTWLFYVLLPVISHSGTQPLSIWVPIGFTVPWLLTFLPQLRRRRR